MKRPLNKVILHILLLPAYLTVIGLAVTLPMGMGGIYWPMVAPMLLLCPPGAYLLSVKGSPRAWIAGLACLFLLGGYQAAIHYIQGTNNYGMWRLDVYMGAAIMLAALVAFAIQRRGYQW